jgi:hypothetical protein
MVLFELINCYINDADRLVTYVDISEIRHLTLVYKKIIPGRLKTLL